MSLWTISLDCGMQLAAVAEFDSTEDILFRVRVTAPGAGDFEHGLLLAEADRIRGRLRAPERRGRKRA